VRREPGGVVLVLCAAGLPHFLLSELGGSLTSAALVGLLIPGSVPLFLAALLFARRRERVAPRRLLALGAILVGVAATTVLRTSPGSLAGIGALLAAGCAWAVYTLGLRRTELDPVGVVLVLCVPSALAAGALGLTGLLPSHLLDGTAPLPAVGLFVVLQGVGTGIVSTLSYAYAVRRLGSSTSATTGALSPVLATVAAVPLFGEPITGGTVVALLFIVGGVVAGNLPPGRRTSRVAGPAGAPSAAVPTPT
jgi:drug/metabolite transporter (DMT)-like permease